MLMISGSICLNNADEGPYCTIVFLNATSIYNMSICSNKCTASRTRLFLCVKHGINAVNVSFAVHMWAIYRTVSSALSLITFFESPSFSAIIGRIILKYNRKFDGSSISDKQVPSVLIALSHTLKLLSFNGTVNVSRIYPRSSLYGKSINRKKANYNFVMSHVCVKLR
jgi:hypothetical protein